LNIKGAANGIDRARKFDQNAVTRGFNDTPAVLGNFGVYEFTTARLKRSESALLVNTHQAAISRDIGRQDGGQSPFDTRLGHRFHHVFRSEFMVEVGGVY
jgi:hypothetical protein